MTHAMFITGATGFVGSHLVDACVQREIPVKALVRAGSKTESLQQPGVTLVTGDLGSDPIPADALDGVKMVVHCAAKVGDWGPVEDYRQVNVEGLRKLLDACIGKPLDRIVILSSLGVYAAGDHYGTDETTPLPDSHMDGYTQTKVEAEKLAQQYRVTHGLPIVILRPGFIYGPRDRTVFPTLIDKLNRGQVMYIAGGRRALNTTYVGNLIPAIFLALEQPHAVGEIYNITDGEFVSKRQFFETIADGLGLKRPKISVPMFLAKRAARFLERMARRRGWTSPPRVTQARLKFLGYNLDFSIAKARTQLGFVPAYSFADGMRATLDAYRAEHPSTK
ncbi:NAD-dependent epimerase/dehydratase family protein [Tuwongella immobilis]|uniref:NAD-dependent epimerase/dehydratase domain-containing protein n=1 Tax=Tuwongella immobilis TaxID=692036 RepID=A0A6C2YRR2_9BACT|nr:NAD-dependent epimerase/dehydratase family protein [Tuwongella immobilis]VIP04166.1 oxidoreductase : Nucleoside-diphosphate-sugar epimerase OS=Singulisphaera acidiphila (strain ATCC BAA-1392 / DSM 18658 / VKM B-2454 / MOB10) GN=Sinac_6089 PE=4 SV=1: 3Beta_HSD [Tuwongella immobilis]VTS05697.1 oxidoreductase : Nucleoside-diphosphate-sugar epimerase OS=Singulisphaera acidiphila (strain ATCC BAA-1392 / DSM 18658 / VKM B-2454 / MOB10) GN=Sinac_6089 PE=4 SV=1: 3Beta_HSD [Tuwongella immobilis]